jgi:hypothetical protein
MYGIFTGESHVFIAADLSKNSVSPLTAKKIVLFPNERRRYTMERKSILGFYVL